MLTVMSTNAQVLTKSSRSTDAHKRVPDDQPTSLGTRAWACQPRRGGIHNQASTLCTCQLPASPSSNMLHRCCARCCTPRGCTCQRRQPASAARSESRWRDDSSTILVDMSRRVSNAPFISSPHRQRRRGRGEEEPSNDARSHLALRFRPS